MQENATASAWLSAAASQLLDQSPGHVAFIDASGQILVVNEAWTRFSLENGGDDATTGVGSNYLHAAKADGGAAYRAIKEVLEGAPLRTVEHPCHSPEERRWFRMRCIRIDAPPAVAAIMHDDLTDHYLANEARRRLEREAARVAELEKDEARMTQALNTISHTLRTPLTPVRLQMATLERKDLPEAEAALVAKMRHNTERLVEAVNEAIRAIEVQQAPLRTVQMSAAHAGSKLHDALEEEGALANVSWHLHANRDVTWDLGLVTPAVAELLRAAKASDPEGHAELDVALDEAAVLTIRHHGEGAPGASDASGLPLALYMCRVAARMHGGTFDTQAARGEVAYRIALPAGED